MKTISLLFAVIIAAIVALGTGITASIFTQEIDAGASTNSPYRTCMHSISTECRTISGNLENTNSG